MALPITPPYTFANATTTQNLSYLDYDFATVYNAVNGIGNGTVALANVNITGGTVNAAFNSTTISYGTSNVTVKSSNGNVAINTAGTESVLVDTSGRLLVNVTSAAGTARFKVATSTEAFTTGGVCGPSNVFAAYLECGNNNGLAVYTTATSGIGVCGFYNPNGQVGSIVTNGTGTTFNTLSDYRLKKNVQPMTSGLGTIKQLNPVTYNWIADESSGEGFIAHELQAVIPHAVFGEKDATNPDGSIKPQGVDYSKIVVHLVSALQESVAKIDALEARITALESK